VINGVHKNMIFDTGADLILLPKDSSNTEFNLQLGDGSGRHIDTKIMLVQNVEIQKNVFTKLYSINMDLPSRISCSCDGVIGNNVLKSCNWAIEYNKLFFSNKPFVLNSKQLSFDIFYFGSNRLHTNFNLNGIQIDSCLIDYGSQKEIELPLRLYEKFTSSFKPNQITKIIKPSFSVLGKFMDTLLCLNCNIDFNGLLIDSVNIYFKEKCERSIGFGFLKRFDTVIINNSNHKLLIGKSIDKIKSSKHESIFSFDWINGFFVVDSKILEMNKQFDLNIGDKFIEINSKKSDDFKNYCDFLSWRNDILNSEYLDLRTTENKTIKIQNWR
jgi:hypothetical protein